jgi:hypothetical protein
MNQNREIRGALRALIIGVASGMSSILAVATASAGVAPAHQPVIKPPGFSAREELLRDQQVSDRMVELDLAPEPAPDFDSDLAKLSIRERQYRERLPSLAHHPRLKSVVSRVSAKPYSSRR